MWISIYGEVLKSFKLPIKLEYIIIPGCVTDYVLKVRSCMALKSENVWDAAFLNISRVSFLWSWNVSSSNRVAFSVVSGDWAQIRYLVQTFDCRYNASIGAGVITSWFQPWKSRHFKSQRWHKTFPMWFFGGMLPPHLLKIGHRLGLLYQLSSNFVNLFIISHTFF